VYQTLNNEIIYFLCIWKLYLETVLFCNIFLKYILHFTDLLLLFQYFMKFGFFLVAPSHRALDVTLTCYPFQNTRLCQWSDMICPFCIHIKWEYDVSSYANLPWLICHKMCARVYPRMLFVTPLVVMHARFNEYRFFMSQLHNFLRVSQNIYQLPNSCLTSLAGQSSIWNFFFWDL